MGNRWDIDVDGLKKVQLGRHIEEMEENGSFSLKEQKQYALLMKTINQNGGFKKLSVDDVRELDHIVKVLGNNSDDKSTMVSDEVTSFLSKITKKTR